MPVSVWRCSRAGSGIGWGDARGNAPGGFLHLDENFDIVGRWENDLGKMKFNYDFWYQPRHNVMVSSEWAAPNTFMPGFDLEEVGQLKYGREIHFWDFANKRVENSVYLGEEGLVPLEVRFHHDPESSHGFVGAALRVLLLHPESRHAFLSGERAARELAEICLRYLGIREEGGPGRA